MTSEIQQFLAYAQAERGFSKDTIRGYGYRLRTLADWCAQRGIGWLEFTEDTAREFLALVERESYRANYIAVLKSFYRWAAEEIGLTDVGTKLDTPKPWQRIPKSLGAADMDKLLKPPEDMSTPRAMCDQAIVELAYASGLRLAELASIEVNNVNLNEKYALVTGKGNKQRLVPFGDPAQVAISRWLEHGRDMVRTGRSPCNLFLNCHGKAFAKRTLHERLKIRARERGLPKVSCHWFRHGAAVALLEGGADLRVIQEFLGHASIATTQIYATATSTHLRSQAEKHPRAFEQTDD